jgi:hypothetical protein
VSLITRITMKILIDFITFIILKTLIILRRLISRIILITLITLIGEQNRRTRAEGELGGAHEEIMEERRRETATRYYQHTLIHCKRTNDITNITNITNIASSTIAPLLSTLKKPGPSWRGHGGSCERRWRRLNRRD